MFERIQRIRRELHQIPELELSLPMTKAYLISQLLDLPCQLDFPLESGITAFFDNGREETIAFRSDMDALPITERSDAPYRSRHEGNMHACGHDGHMAMLLGLAFRLASADQRLPHNVLLIFQPGEENPGGARLLCEAGILERYHVKRIYGMHLWPQLPAGVIGTRREEMMARSSEVNIDITGKSAHAASYQEGCDALETACRYLCDLYAMERQIDPAEYRLLRFGVLRSGSIRNVVSDHARLEGTMRACRDEIYDHMRDQLDAIARRYAPAQFAFSFSEGYPALVNTPQIVDQALQAIPDMILLEEPQLITEDFSWYLQHVPGMFMFLGTGTGIPLHSDHFDFDEHILMRGIEALFSLSKLE
ncbi:MAG: M20 metallopeptidase family protein [Merdibacter sp.]